MTRPLTAAIALVAVLALASCGKEQPPAFPEGFAPSVQQSIDRAEKARDCDALQKAFDDADRNQAASRARGASAGDLMEYIEAARDRAGC